ncbi:MAG TPA: hypothetical protein VJH68_02490, partial [Candidatus Nanoarchaeia archaeon]|nr:hypothetical protein [Candidatus Nanoarchaeia archaeon]
AVKDLLELELKQRLLLADHCISDLDHTDVNGSPAEDLAKQRIGVSSTSLGNLRYANWVFWTGLEFLSAYRCDDCETAIEKVKEQRFSAYDHAFLRTSMVNNCQRELKREVQQELTGLVNGRYLAQSLFSGVREFYRALPARKMYLSRNLRPVVEAYAGFLGFTGVESEVKLKRAVLEHLLLHHRSMKRLIFRIDGVAEDEMINTAKFYQRQKWSQVEDVLVLKRSLEMNDDFKTADVLMGSNDYGLVDIMNGRKV